MSNEFSIDKIIIDITKIRCAYPDGNHQPEIGFLDYGELFRKKIIMLEEKYGIKIFPITKKD